MWVEGSATRVRNSGATDMPASRRKSLEVPLIWVPQGHMLPPKMIAETLTEAAFASIQRPLQRARSASFYFCPEGCPMKVRNSLKALMGRHTGIGHGAAGWRRLDGGRSGRSANGHPLRATEQFWRAGL